MSLILDNNQMDLTDKYREEFYSVDRFHGSGLHGDRCAACCDAHMNFANKSACLTADNVRNEVRSQEVLKMLSLYTQIYFAIICFVKKNTGITVLALTAHQTPAFTG
jgi:hypothetical protein